MARNRIAEAYVELKARGAEKVKAALRSVNGDLKGTERGTNKLNAGLGRIGKGAERVQSAMGRLLIPVAVLTSVASLLQQITKLAVETERTRREMRRMGRDVSSLQADISIAARGFGSGTQEALDLYKQIVAQLEQFDAKQQGIIDRARDNPLGEAFRSAVNFVNDDLVDTADEQIAAIEASANTASSRLKSLTSTLREAIERTRQETAEIANAENEVLLGRSSRLVEILKLEQDIGKAQRANNDALSEALQERLQIIEDLYARERQAAIESNRQILRDFERTQREAVPSLFDSQSQSFKRIEDLLARQINKLEQIRKLPR